MVKCVCVYAMQSEMQVSLWLRKKLETNLKKSKNKITTEQNTILSK